MTANEPEEWRWTSAQGRLVEEVRLRKGLSQKEAAAIMAVSDDTLRNWVSGRPPRKQSLAAIAKFCEVSVAELMRPQLAGDPAPPSSPVVENPQPDKNRRLQPAVLAVPIALAAIAVTSLVLWYWRANQFKEIQETNIGLEAISRSGKVLWRAETSGRWTWVRSTAGRRLIACVLGRRGDYRPEAVSTLSFLEPNAKRLTVVQRVQLPSTGWMWFPTYSRRYELASINAVDIDVDGVDEILATYHQVPECMSYTILYEPGANRARFVLGHTGAHHFTGAWDLDGDGRRELIFLGINNGYNWMNALTAIQVTPRVGAVSVPDGYHAFSPDSANYIPHESRLLYYALLPRGRVPDDPSAVTWDARQRVLTVHLLNGRVAALTPFGFPASSSDRRSEREREASRRDAYRHNREARGLSRAGFAPDAVADARLAVGAAERSGDRIVHEVMQRDLAKLLIEAGQAEEGETLGLRLAAKSENSSEIYYDLAVAFHMASDLRRAVAYYESGIRRGGSPEEGKSKHEFIQGEVLALTELGAFGEAEQAINRFRDRYVANPEDWTAMYREFARWRKGETPDPTKVVVPPNATDLQRYWMLEFANANGADPRVLLRSADTLLEERNYPLGPLLSLRAILLHRLGRHTEAALTVREAMEEGRREAKLSIIGRGHLPVITARYASLSAPPL